jgi:xylan 1,4-beta-xylosidase
MDRREFVLGGAAGFASVAAAVAAQARPVRNRPAPPLAGAQRIEIDLGRDTGPLSHAWENAVGSDRLAVAFREPWIEELRVARQLAGFRAVRCHGLFDDEMGICRGLDASGPVTSFVYLDQVYDRLLELGVKPFVELSFMPSALASSRNAVFWYRGNASPPKDFTAWGQLVAALARHLVQRYGIAEVATWRFECWNEPNLGFWAGTQAQYFELYRVTAAALKGVDARLQVGGPATAMMMWIPAFLDYCRTHAVSVDFVSAHVYPDDPQETVFGAPQLHPFEAVIPRALEQANAQIEAAGFRGTPLVLSEWSSQNPAFIAHTLEATLGMADTLAFWQVSSVFEEQGTPASFDTSLYGLFIQSGVPRASLHAFTLLHRLGQRRVAAGVGPVLASRRDDGSGAVLAWNLAPRNVRGMMGDPLAAFQAEVLPPGPVQHMVLQLRNVAAPAAQLTLLDPARSSAEAAYLALGRPQYPSRDEIAELKRRAALPSPQAVPIRAGAVEFDLPANAIALLEVPAP